ncbi:glycosyltransferase [Salinisphaera sp. P385]|uniref:Glycosyltransferase n=1 Tax=Spectribacter acetivorans TaxID=3075603 RepID=A0ABU3BE12_9GAMM|nr:glycosyltransferase [Salinisphaera sp. P385]MDT0619876.1 glycosyltransferase [Salinisphaera sp. P385]
MMRSAAMDSFRKRLLFFYFGSGQFRYGIAEVFRHVLNGLDKQRYDLFLVITGTLNESVDNLSADVTVIELGHEGLKKSFLPLVKAIRRIRPDLVVSAMVHPNVLAALARLVSRYDCKLVLTVHSVITPQLENMWSEKQGRMIRKAVQLTYPSADHLVYVSRAVKEDFEKYFSRLPGVSVIHNPVLKESALPEPDFTVKEPGLIAVSSRLTGYKKIDEAISALQFLEERYHLVVMGDGPERGRLEALVAELDLDERVEFTGYVDDPFAWYRKAEIFVLPSVWEGFGNVLIESMACGCQVVANASAWAPPEVLGYGEYGFLYEGGQPEALASAIKKAATEPKPKEKLLRYAQRFTDKRVAREYEQLFDSLVGSPRMNSSESQ